MRAVWRQWLKATLARFRMDLFFSINNAAHKPHLHEENKQHGDVIFSDCPPGPDYSKEMWWYERGAW